MEVAVTLTLAVVISWSEYEKLKKGDEVSIYHTFANHGKIKVCLKVKPEDFSKKENPNPDDFEEKKKRELCDTVFFERDRELLIRIPLSELEDPMTRRISGEIEGEIPTKSFQIDID